MLVKAALDRRRPGLVGPDVDEDGSFGEQLGTRRHAAPSLDPDGPEV
jgi:hypothetical protein